MNLNQSQKAIGELLLTTCFWGFGFVVIVWSLGEVGPYWVNAVRFLGSASVLLLACVCTKSLRQYLSWSLLWRSMMPGLVLCSTLILQTAGLQYTSATNSGFITTLYALFVPLTAFLIFRKPIPRIHWLYVSIALLGTAMICGLLHNSSVLEVNKGDILTLACALTATSHILLIDRIAKKIPSPIVFHFFQCLWGGVLALLAAIFFQDKFPTSPSFELISSLSFLMLACTVFGLLSQVRAQKVLSPSVASMMFLLESPFSAFFAFIFLKERLDIIQWIGAALILGSAAMTVKTETISGTS